MAMEPSLSRQAAYESFRRALPGMTAEELRGWCERLAHLAVVMQPAAISWLVDEAVRGMSTEKGLPLMPPVMAVHEQQALKVEAMLASVDHQL